MKKRICFYLATLAIIGFVGCKTVQKSYLIFAASQEEKIEEIPDPFCWNTPELIYPYTGSVPEFLSNYQQELFIAANCAYNYLHLVDGFHLGQETITLNKKEYTLDHGFLDYNSFLAYWRNYFTDDFIRAHITNHCEKYIEHDNKLYVTPQKNTPRKDYQYSSFEAVSGNNETVIFNIIGHYDDSSYHTESPLGPTTKSFRIVMKNTKDGWKFDEFATPY